MNFSNMRELGFKFGYPLALGLMALAAFAPYWYFKRKDGYNDLSIKFNSVFY